MNLLTHLGLGDHLITYGLVRELSFKYDKINLYCKINNLSSLLSIYKGSNVFLSVVDSEDAAFKKMAINPFDSLKIGYISQSETEQDFARSFYQMANIDFEIKNKYSIGLSDVQLKRYDDIFIHDTSEFKINIEGFRPNYATTPDITQYFDIIENAKEIHIIESSFKQLIEFMNPKGKLFLHKFKNKSFRIVSSIHNWNIIEHEDINN